MKYFILLFSIAMAATISAQAGSPAAPLKSALDKYIQVQTALAGDSLMGVTEAATDISAIAKASDGSLPESLAGQASVLAKATDIEAAREAFKALSTTMILALSAQKTVSGQYYEAFCPMANASWIQAGKEVANPYFGSSMLKCGEIRKSFDGKPQADLPVKSGMGCCGS